MKISIVTVSMNRTEHLKVMAAAVSRLTSHVEHVIVDFGSSLNVRRDDLPADDRIALHRVDSPIGKWWLTHSYNLAFALSSGDHILKIDADIVISQEYMNALLARLSDAPCDLLCNRLTLQDWNMPHSLFASNGLFLCSREALLDVNGFNAYIQGWGWDEVDLYSRIFFAGWTVGRMPATGVEMIRHGNDLRDHPMSSSLLTANRLFSARSTCINSSRRISAQNQKNRRIATASLLVGAKWPSLSSYAACFHQFRSLPSVDQVSLFEGEEKQALIDELRRILLAPSRWQNLLWRVMGFVGLGPYAPINTRALLDACNIDLSRVS